jgi:hypothetical protein
VEYKYKKPNLLLLLSDRGLFVTLASVKNKLSKNHPILFTLCESPPEAGKPMFIRFRRNTPSLEFIRLRRIAKGSHSR